MGCVSEQPNLAELLRDVSTNLATAADKIDAAQLLEQERREKIREQFTQLLESVVKMSDLLEELVK